MLKQKIAQTSIINTQLKNQKLSEPVIYAIHATPFGTCLIAVASQGICHISFADNYDEKSAQELLFKELGAISLLLDQKATQSIIKNIFSKNTVKQNLLLIGTDFQIKVWQALLNIPSGKTTTYATIAQKIGKPKSVRAVANAIAHNNISWLVPCHRVIATSGKLSGYRWGVERKKQMLAFEKSM